MAPVPDEWWRGVARPDPDKACALACAEWCTIQKSLLVCGVPTRSQGLWNHAEHRSLANLTRGLKSWGCSHGGQWMRWGSRSTPKMKQPSGRHNFVILCYMSAGCNQHDLRLPLLIGIAAWMKNIYLFDTSLLFFREQIMYKKTIKIFILSYNNVFENIRKKINIKFYICTF